MEALHVIYLPHAFKPHNWTLLLVQNLGELSESENMFKLSLEARILCVGKESPLVANTHFELSEVLGMRDKQEEAVHHARRALAIRQETLSVRMILI